MGERHHPGLGEHPRHLTAAAARLAEVSHVRGGIRQVEHGPVDRHQAQCPPPRTDRPLGARRQRDPLNSIFIALSPSRARA